jgi:hypothetical protein
MLDPEKRPPISESVSSAVAAVAPSEKISAATSARSVVGVVAGSRIVELAFLYGFAVQQPRCARVGSNPACTVYQIGAEM